MDTLAMTRSAAHVDHHALVNLVEENNAIASCIGQRTADDLVDEPLVGLLGR